MATVDEIRKKYPNLSDDQIASLADVAMQVANNKKTRKGFLGLYKEVSPDTPIPEIDEVAAVNAEIEKRDKRIQDLEQRFDNRIHEESLARAKNDAKSKFGLSEDDMTAMEKMMTEKKLPADYTWAAKLYKQQTDSATPTNYGTSGWGPLDIERNAASDEFKGLMEDEAGWSVRTAHQMIDDMQKGGKAPGSF